MNSRLQHPVSAVLLAIVWLVAGRSTLGNTFIVTNRNDNSAPGSLRWAILAANTNPGPDVINFTIPSTNATVQTILLQSDLPPIMDAVTIDGRTQPGFAGSPIIELDGTTANGVGLELVADANTIRGLVINRFLAIGIYVRSSFNRIEGNFIGTDASGTIAAGNGEDGLRIETDSNTIGGTTPGAGNLISGNDGGISVFGSSNTVQGNFVGTDITGRASLSNSFAGVILFGPGNLVGGVASGAGNLISGNAGYGIMIIGANNLVEGNLIGTDITGTNALANALDGVSINGPGVTVGGLASGAGNVLAFNANNGVKMVYNIGDAVLGNSIFSNGLLGIDLGGDGVTTNDFPDADGFQNYPRLTSAVSGSGSTTIHGTLKSATNASFRLEFFSNLACDTSCSGTNCFGEGETFIGSTNVTTDGAGNTSFGVSFPVTVPAGQVITATATGSANHTSEFSPCQVVIPAGPDLTGFWPTNLIESCAFTAKLQPYIMLKGPFSVRNQGAGPAPATVLTFFLSNDDILDGTDFLLRKVVCRSLAPNQTRQIGFRGKLPPCTSAMTKFVIAVVNADGRVSESDTNNNKIVFGPIP